MQMCSESSCINAAAVQWQRVAVAGGADVQTVYACTGHAITLDAAALVHQADCTAPDPARLPGCSCTPAAPAVDPVPEVPVVTLPTGWTVPEQP